MKNVNLLSLAEMILVFMLVLYISECLHELLLWVEKRPSGNVMLGEKGKLQAKTNRARPRN